MKQLDQIHWVTWLTLLISMFHVFITAMCMKKLLSVISAISIVAQCRWPSAGATGDPLHGVVGSYFFGIIDFTISMTLASESAEVDAEST